MKKGIAFLAIPIMLLNSTSAYAADIKLDVGSVSSVADEFDSESSTIDMGEVVM